MDPWGTADNSPHKLQNNNITELKFDDEFTSYVIDGPQKELEKLPDSSTYLASLERKLAKLQKKDMTEASAKKMLMESARSSRDTHLEQFISTDDKSVMLNLLNDSSESVDSLSNSLIRYLAPHRQALSVSELMELLKADELGIESQTGSGSTDESER